MMKDRREADPPISTDYTGYNLERQVEQSLAFGTKKLNFAG
jgi:hypothetical protein